MVLACALPVMSAFVNLRSSFLQIRLCFILGCQNQREDPSKTLQGHLVTLPLPGLLPEIRICQYAHRAHLSNWCTLPFTPAIMMPLLPCASCICWGNPCDISHRVFELISHDNAFTRTNFMSINRAVDIYGLIPVWCKLLDTQDLWPWAFWGRELHYLLLLWYQPHQDWSQLKAKSVIRWWIIQTDNNGRHY